MVETTEAKQNYEVPFTYKKHFTPEQCTEMISAFKNYDENGDGTIDSKEFKNALKNMGHDNYTDEQVMAMLKTVDKNDDGVIEWVEFLDMMRMVKQSGANTNFGETLMTKSGQAAAKMDTGTGSHTYMIEERSSISRLINNKLKDKELLKDRLPMDPDSDDLFHVCSDGMVFIHLLNLIDDSLVDMRTVNKGSNLNIYKVRENLELAFAAAAGVIRTTGTDAQDFLDKTPHMILGVMWQLAAKIAVQSISLKDCPEIMRLAESGEELEDLMKVKPEAILLRWMNFHLSNAGQNKITNLGKDLKDSKALIYVCNQLDSTKCSTEALSEEDDIKRAEKMLQNTKDLGCQDVIGPHDLLKGNQKVNSILVAELFNTKHGLEELTKEEYDAAGIIDDDIEGSKEERAFRLWINSLQLEDCFVNNLYEDCRDGLVLLKTFHRVDKTCVDWTNVVQKPKNVFDKNANCDAAEDAAKKLRLMVVSGCAEDIRDGNKKGLLQIVWQLMRVHYLKIIGSKTEKDLINWVNEAASDGEPVTGFSSQGWSSGKLLIKLCAAIEPRVVNWDLVTEGQTDEDKEMNAKYAISIARKLGCAVFCVWDDIVNLNKKMILIFVCSLYDMKHNIE